VSDEDDWVALRAAAACLAAAPDDADRAAALLRMAEAHADDAAYAEPVGLAAAVLLGAGRDESVRLAAAALGRARSACRTRLTHILMAVAQAPEAATRIEDYLVSRSVRSLDELCLALALRGAGHSTAGLNLPADVPSGANAKVRLTHLALMAVANDERAAEELKSALRAGRPEERYYAAMNLGLARARSAALLFSSVRDQEEAPYMLRALCGASLIRCGQPDAFVRLDKLLTSSDLRVRTEVVRQVCRAVEDTIPLMLKCTNVNGGRFV
jgi:hypothetical protein